MPTSSNVIIAPTLATMARVYQLSTSGGPRSPRFAAYVGLVEHGWGLSSFNPMAGDVAARSVDALIALDAEAVAAEAAKHILDACAWTAPITLAIVVPSPGMWTDRLATEVRHRTLAERRSVHGEILLWSGDAPDADDIRHESAAEAVRTIWTSLHGPTRTLSDVLSREGLAYALARPSTEPAPLERAVGEALEVLGDTSTLADIIGVLYGDSAASTLGYTPLGLSERAGYEWAIGRALAEIARVGAAGALLGGPLRTA
ncbi:MAG: hypothetical protein M3Z05_07150 [Gemmatimonadota bacterium]|nr:hypothetical protein [Gemmatimonadota bacterium]